MAEQGSTLREELAGRLAPAADAVAAVARAQQAADAVKRDATFGTARAMEAECAVARVPAAASSGGLGRSDLSFLSDVNLKVRIELGRTRMYVEDVLQLNAGSVVELDKPAGDPVDIYINDQLIARGEVVVLNDNFCVKVTEIIQRATIEP
jgi:flagellar motor switch protein FliN/FliY